MGRGVWYIVAVGLVIIVAVGGTGEYSVRSATCMACHSQEASFAQWMAGRLKAEKKGFAHELIACADCHIEERCRDCYVETQGSISFCNLHGAADRASAGSGCRTRQ
jgi:nitrate/TMAO reductase-like tetraheme cytochrome c subunit